MAIISSGRVSGRWAAGAVGAAAVTVLCTAWRYRSKRDKLVASQRRAQCVQNVSLPTEASYYLLARGGDLLGIIAARHGVYIMMDSRKSRPDEEHVYRVSGPTTAACEDAVRDMQEVSGPARRAREGGKMAALASASCQTVETPVTSQLLREPGHITDLQEIFIALRMHTGVRISLLTNGQACKVSISGSTQQVEHSYFVLTRFLTEKKFMGSAPDVPNEDGGRPPLMVQSNAPDVPNGDGGRPPLMVQGVAGTMAGSVGDLCPLFVATLFSPSRFFVRLVSMDETNRHFQEKMSTHYRAFPPGQQMRPRVGDLVAARFVVSGPKGDSYLDADWYRGLVTEEHEGPAGGATKYTVNYIDHGDFACVPAFDIRRLHARYCCMPIQAIPACLSSVRPVPTTPDGDATEGSKRGTVDGSPTWPDDAIDEFDVMTQCANSHPLVARLAAVVPDDGADEGDSSNGEGGRASGGDGSSRGGIETYLGPDPSSSLRVTHLYDTPSVNDLGSSLDAEEADIVRKLVAGQMATYL